jgi:transglycosylase-like protein with SLT domain/putative peptidoglycan binding protein
VSRSTATVAAFVAALALAPAAGAFNPQIAGLQIALRQHGLYRGPIDAVQGPKTVRAVRVFQRRHRLVVDGIAGPQTRAALGGRGRPLFGARVMRRGSRGYDVGVLQFLLRRRGLQVGPLDGRFGARTAAAVRRFQRRAGLRPDAIVGPRTTRRLCALRVCAWRVQSRAPRTSIHASIDYWSRTYGVDPRLVRAVAYWESGLNNSVVSRAGARGVMQITPKTWDYVETVLIGRQIPDTPSGNIQVGVAFLHQLLREFRGDSRLALAAYFQGPRSVRRRGLLPETRHYVSGVLALTRR